MGTFIPPYIYRVCTLAKSVRALIHSTASTLRFLRMICENFTVYYSTRIQYFGWNESSWNFWNKWVLKHFNYHPIIHFHCYIHWLGNIYVYYAAGHFCQQLSAIPYFIRLLICANLNLFHIDKNKECNKICGDKCAHMSINYDNQLLYSVEIYCWHCNHMRDDIQRYKFINVCAKNNWFQYRMWKEIRPKEKYVHTFWRGGAGRLDLVLPPVRIWGAN